jgi:hypothetical protein
MLVERIEPLKKAEPPELALYEAKSTSIPLCAIELLKHSSVEVPPPS